MSKNQVIEVKEPNISKMLSTKLDVDVICEWAHISGDQPTLENDSEFDNRQIFQLKRDQFVKASIKLNERFNQNQGNTIKLNGNLVNNLKGKAFIIAQQNCKNGQQKEEKLDYSEYNKVQICKGEDSHDKRVFRLPENNINKKEKELQQEKRNRIVELQLKKIDIKQINFIETWDYLKRQKDIKEQIQFLEQRISLIEKLIGCFGVHLKNIRLINEINKQYSSKQGLYYVWNPFQ